MSDSYTIGTLLLDRLYKLGLHHIFGIPGDYVLTLFKLIEESPIRHIGTTREDCAGFAADAYARIHGIGGACVTYCVGGLNMVNAVACAYAERSPVVLISGSPGLNERVNNPFLHHMVRDFSTQRDVFEKITVASVVLDDPHTAEREIDRALKALMQFKRPIYLEIPRDLVMTPVQVASIKPPTVTACQSDPAALKEAVAEVRGILSGAERPVILAGAEIHRFGLQDQLTELVEHMNVPIATTLLGKSVLREDHPLNIGVYGGLVGREEILEFVENADCLLTLGTLLTDVEDVKAHATLLAAGRTVHATADSIAIKHHKYEDVRFEDFIQALVASPLPSFPARALPPRDSVRFDPPGPDAAVTLRKVFGYLDGLLNEKTVVIADVGESLFAAADLRVRKSADFLSPAYYTSMGFSVPAALGAGFADPGLRPLVLVGDGAFQMTGTELSTCIRYGQAPIVVVLNNRGYGTEREILEGPFNDIHEWQYEKICDVLGGGVGHRVGTFGDLVQALSLAVGDPKQVHVLNVLLDPRDRSTAMKRVAQRLAKRMGGQKT
ncbi:alpha-keto acid decarboxylase family protein [Candidatus Nitrospira allomarina]|uniref:Thiamine pyrophosphate-binding protein n=1 Tax=Candidatus Nitrospira allomarina TaxID=3020900 RepID=A0AA96GAM4_9BACT|nr:thiamine pyrophosphate-binding protein [Candidatus Nitrospira allomarina]WNM56450.1 thiamine pyrophosphate-binding protein [Candidatus Nitrospira allomarina]